MNLYSKPKCVCNDIDLDYVVVYKIYINIIIMEATIMRQRNNHNTPTALREQNNLTKIPVFIKAILFFVVFSYKSFAKEDHVGLSWENMKGCVTNDLLNLKYGG